MYVSQYSRYSFGCKRRELNRRPCDSDEVSRHIVGINFTCTLNVLTCHFIVLLNTSTNIVSDFLRYYFLWRFKYRYCSYFRIRIIERYNQTRNISRDYARKFWFKKRALWLIIFENRCIHTFSKYHFPKSISSLKKIIDVSRVIL